MTDKRLKYNDQYHTYWIDGQKATGVSGVAKGFQDSYNIDRKVKRDVAKGMARRPDLCTMVAALGDDDSWETKKKIDKIATDAVEASGAWAKANHGTAKHTILERVHKGLSLDDVFDDRLVAYADAYRALIERSGLIPIDFLTERFVVYPQEMIAGRMDCAYINKADYRADSLLLGDFKSGSRAVAYPHSIVAQLGLYLNAPFLYNEATDEFDPAPLWGDTIIIAHVPDNLDDFGLWTIDADMARTVALAALERHRYIRSQADTLVKQWIVPSTVAQPVDPFDGLTSTLVEQQVVPMAAASHSSQIFAASAPVAMAGAATSTAGVPGEAKMPPAPNNQEDQCPSKEGSTNSSEMPTSPSSTNSGKQSASATTEATDSTSLGGSPRHEMTSTKFSDFSTSPPERRQWIIERLKVLQQTAGALDRVGILWPDNTPTLKASDRHTDEQLDLIVAVIDQVEAEYTIPFGTPDPTIEKEESRWTNTDPLLSSTQEETWTKSNNVSSPLISTSAKPVNSESVETTEASTTSPAPSNSSRQRSNSSPSPDEGPDVDPDTIKTLETAYTGLDDAGRAWIARIAHDAQTAGRPIHLSVPTVRRFEIVRGLVALAAAGYAEDEILRAVVALTLKDDQPALLIHLTPGAIASILDARAAPWFSHVCQAFCDGDIAMHIDDNNTIQLTPTNKGK